MDEVDLNATDDSSDAKINGQVFSSQAFSLRTLTNCFHAALIDGGSNVKMVPYLAAFKEIVKFLELLGTVFHFVIVDVKSKIAILEAYACVSSHHQGASAADAAAAAAHYGTVHSMVEHEVLTGAVHSSRSSGGSKHKPSGCRTLLRLHRALEYTLLFFRRLHDADAGVKLSALSSGVYGETLSKHHPWVIRKAVSVAMYAMPSRQGLLDRLQSSPGNRDGLMMPNLLEAADSGKLIYDVIESLFAKNELLDLP